MTAEIRPLRPDDDLAALTDLLHRGYAAHAASGLRFWATHQSVDDTRKRFAQGQGFVAVADGRFVGTITVRPPSPESEVPLFRDPGTWSFGQFTVAPEWAGRGLGRALHDAALAHAASRGARRMALDTAAPADRLIEMYRRWGYRVCGEWDWRPDTNYPSVLMEKVLE
ncbi:MAG: GNAT family N-acetyltransferase [Planctomycetia bacterium]|nr:GNAT family N-acetyltransferase [Planctomycetia bacterium]